MASELVEIADAVVADLNAQLSGWGFSGVTAERKYAPSFDKRELANPAFTVMPMQTAIAAGTRGQNEYRHTVMVDVRRATDGNDLLSDNLMDVVELIADRYRMRIISGTTNKAQCTDAEVAPAYQTEDMRNLELFAAAASLTFLVVRAPK